MRLFENLALISALLLYYGSSADDSYIECVVGERREVNGNEVYNTIRSQSCSIFSLYDYFCFRGEISTTNQNGITGT